MPRIYDPGVQDVARIRSPEVNPLASLSQSLKMIGAKIEEGEQNNMARDLGELDRALVMDVQNLRANGRYDAHTGKTYIGDQELPSSAPDFALGRFDELSSELYKKYGSRLDGELERRKTAYFSKAASQHLSMKFTANEAYMGEMAEFWAGSIENGSVELSEAQEGYLNTLNATELPPELRQRVQESATDMFMMSVASRDLENNVGLAVERYKSNTIYSQASEVAEGRIGSMIADTIKGMARKEMSDAANAASLGFSFSPNPSLSGWAKDMGMKELSAELKVVQATAVRRNALVAGDLNMSSARTAAILKNAQTAQDPMAVMSSIEDLKFIQARKDLVASDPESAMRMTGIEVSEPDISDPMSFVDGRQQIKNDAEKNFGVEAAFLGTQAPQIVSLIKNSPVDERAFNLIQYSSAMDDEQKANASRELSEVSPNVGVSMSLAPNKGALHPSVQIERMNLITAINSDGDATYKVKGSDLNSFVAQYFNGVELGDSRVKNLIVEAAVNAYEYRAGTGNVDPSVGIQSGSGRKLFKKTLDEITGGTISWGDKRVLNFMLPDGRWADPEVAEDSLTTAIQSGLIRAFGSDGLPIPQRDMVDYGELVPTGVNGKYYMRRRGALTEFFTVDGVEPMQIDMASLYGAAKTQSVVDNFLLGF